MMKTTIAKTATAKSPVTDAGIGIVRFKRSVSMGAAALLSGFVALSAADVSPRKQALIQQAMTSMKLDGKIQSLVEQRVEGRAQRLRADNPGISDTALEKARVAIRAVYAENRAGRDGLDAKVYAVFDRHLTEEDLQFVTNFNGSDNGKRYREVAPRIVKDCVDAGLRWAEKLEPEIRRRLEEEFRGERLKI